MRDITLGQTIDFKFCTCEPDTGAPATLSGTPVISAYVDNSTTQITAGITLSVDFDGVTGLNNVRVVATSGNGYAAGTDVALIITTGTVDGVSAVGYKVAEFSIGRPSTANVTQFGGSNGTFASGRPEVNLSHIAGSAVSTTTAQLGVNVVQVSGDANAADNLETAFDDTAGAVPWQGIIDQGTAQSATATTLVLRAGAAFADDEIIGSTIVITGGSAGVGQARAITDYVGATDTATVDTWTTTPSGTITYKIYGTAASSGGGGGGDATEAKQDTIIALLGTPADDIAADIAAVKTVVDAVLVDTGTTLDGKIDTIDNLLDTEIAALTTAVADIPTNAELTTALADLPTNAELATALGTADDAVLAQIALVKAQTDQLSFDAGGGVDANITHVIGDAVQENGATDTAWGGTP